MACKECRRIQKWRYKHESDATQMQHLMHIIECNYYANHYLIRLLTGKCNKIEKDQLILLLCAFIKHKGILKYHIFQHKDLFKRLCVASLHYFNGEKYDMRLITHFLSALGTQQID